jgi:hypothetical protein
MSLFRALLPSSSKLRMSVRFCEQHNIWIDSHSELNLEVEKMDLSSVIKIITPRFEKYLPPDINLNLIDGDKYLYSNANNKLLEIVISKIPNSFIESYKIDIVGFCYRMIK